MNTEKLNQFLLEYLLSTKRLIVDVIRFQPGETLTEILDSTSTAEQVGDTPNLLSFIFFICWHHIIIIHILYFIW